MKKNKFLTAVTDYFTNMDKILWLIMLFIISFSLVLLKSVSRATYSDYFSTQFVAVVVGLIGAVAITIIGYVSISNYWYLIAAASIFLMLYTLVFGINISSSGGVNATAWISLGGRTFQPSELVKIGFMVTFAKHLHYLKETGKILKFKSVISLAVHGAIPVILCHFQGDDGAGVVFFAMFVVMSLAAGVQLRYFLILGGVVLLMVPVLWNYVLSEYQKLRFTAVYNLDDPVIAMNEGYQQYQARISIGSGGLAGQGLFNGQRVASNVVTFQHSDFIFSVAGEEMGLLGCTLIMLSLIALMWRILYVAYKSKDGIGKYMCFGFFGLIALQTVSNIGMCLALLPVMGVTLPFYSAGGSSAACLYLGVGLVQSVYMKRNDTGALAYESSKLVRPGYRKFAELNSTQTSAEE